MKPFWEWAFWDWEGSKFPGFILIVVGILELLRRAVFER